MGVSTDGILCYGVDLGEDPEGLPWYGLEDEDGEEVSEVDWYCDLMGCPNTKDLWAEFYAWKETDEGRATEAELRAASGRKELYTVYEDTRPEWRDGLSAVYDARREVEKQMPFEIVRHCSGDYPMYIVAVPGSLHKAHRGSPVTIPALDIDLEALTRTTQFCAFNEIPFEDPQWILTSMWW